MFHFDTFKSEGGSLQAFISNLETGKEFCTCLKAKEPPRKQVSRWQIAVT